MCNTFINSDLYFFRKKNKNIKIYFGTIFSHLHIRINLQIIYNILFYKKISLFCSFKQLI